MRQCYNPYLPLWEYVPDGEPHLYEGRVYLYGSHDAAGGNKYCVGDYVAWSAPEDDLTDWRCEGVIYRRTQDPSNADDAMQLWAPDVTRGPDGRYYLYYCLSFHPEIGVAVSDSPAGPFTFYGHVHYPAHLMGGKKLAEFMPFDPAVLTDDDGRVYLYYGFAPACEKEMKLPRPEDVPPEVRPKIEALQGVKMGENAMVAELEPDMLTLKEIPRACLPGGHHTQGTGFEGHGFFEAASMRKIGGKYYLVYSSHKSHELCYAVSDHPDRDFVYGGTIVSNGDVGLGGRTSPVNTLGNNHGGLVQAGGQWYIFYHRQTHGTEFSRQGCAERVDIAPDGSIAQVEITSCGLNGGPLAGEGVYPAAIACHLTSPTTTDFIDYANPVMTTQTRIVEESAGSDPEKAVHFVADVADGTVVGYKYFAFQGLTAITLEVRGDFRGEVTVSADADGGQVLGRAALELEPGGWTRCTVPATGPKGVYPLYFTFTGQGKLDLRTFALHKGDEPISHRL